MIKTHPILIAALIILSLSGTSIAGLSVSGSIIRGDITPGGHFESQVGIGLGKNDTPLDFNVSLAGFGQSIDGGNVELDSTSQTLYMASFLKPSVTSFHVDPGNTEHLILSGDVPNDVGKGGKYALLYVKSNSMETKNEKVRVALAIEVPIFLTINGSEQIKTGKITSLKLTDPATAKYQNFTAIFNNTGNYHYKFLSHAELKDSSGKVVGDVSNSPLFREVLPLYARSVTFMMAPSTPLAPGKYNLSATVSLEDGTVLDTKNLSVEIKS